MRVVLTSRFKLELFKRFLESREIQYQSLKMAEGVEELEINDKFQDEIKSYLKDFTDIKK